MSCTSGLMYEATIDSVLSVSAADLTKRDKTMTELIQTIEVSGFRNLSSLKIDGFGKVNLITGKNNSGKSTLLEAIRILATGGSLEIIQEILNFREEFEITTDREKSYAPSDLVPLCNLFYGFPNLVSCQTGFSISASGKLPPSVAKIRMSIQWATIKQDPEQNSSSIELVPNDTFDDIGTFPSIYIEGNNKRRIVPLEKIQSRIFRSEPNSTITPCIYLDSFSSSSTDKLGRLWDTIALTDVESEVVSALKVISEDIQAVSMISNGRRSSAPRTVIVKSSRFPSPIPLRTFGDGLNRLFGIILSLCNARNGVLLVDEIENGLHYSVQTAIWRIVFRLAKSLNVQVFATSHSWDCVRAFQEAASESPEDGVLVRLDKKGDATLATLFTEKELEIVTRDQVEVR